MPFIPSKLLIETGNSFFLYSLAITTEAEKASNIFPRLPDLLSGHNTRIHEVDEENKRLINFIKQISSIMVVSQNVKTGKESITTLLVLLYRTFTDTRALQENAPLLWKYLLTKTAGRYIIYRLLQICFVHKDIDNELFLSLKEGLSENSTCAMEVDTLEFLELMHKKSLTVEPSEEKESLETKNNYVKSYLLLTEKDNPLLKIKKLTDLASLPLKFNKTLPAFNLELVLIYNTLDFKAEIGINPEQIPLFSPVISLLADNNYLIKLKSPIEHKTTLDYFIYENILFSKYVEGFAHKHTLFNESVLHQKHTSLLCQTISHFDKLTELGCLTNNELKWLGIEAYKLIANNLLYLSFEEKNKFYQSMIKMLSFMRPISLFFSEINTIIDMLFYRNNEIEAQLILACFTQFENISNKKDYIALASAINFVSELNVTSESAESDSDVVKKYNIEQSKKLFKIILTDLKIGKHNFNALTLCFMKNKFEHLAADFKWKFIKTIEALQSKIDFLRFSTEEKELFQAFQASVFQLATILDLNKDELEKLKSDLVYDDHLYFELFDDVPLEEKKEETEPTSVANKKQEPYKKQKQKLDTVEEKEETPVTMHTPLSLQTMFKTNKMVSRNKLPTALLDLSCLVHDLTGQYLNLTGGAVSYLCLNKEDPNDFDCLLLDTDLEILQHRLQAEGFSCKLIGNRIKVLKIAFIENGKRIDIDIVSEKTHGKQRHTAMKKILAFRDFGISSLYVHLSKDELLKIHGFNHTLRIMNKKKINIVGNNMKLFIEDPTRLIRLAKIQELYPDFSMDSTLVNILKNTNFTECFTKFINHKKSTHTNRRRVNTSLQTLFARFDLMTVIERISKLPIIEGLTGLTYESLLPTLDILKPYAELENPSERTLVFYQYIYIHLCLLQRYENEPLKDSPFYKMAWALPLEPKDKIYFSYIEEKLLGTKLNGFVNPPKHLSDIINHIECHFKSLEEAKLDKTSTQTKTLSMHH